MRSLFALCPPVMRHILQNQRNGSCCLLSLTVTGDLRCHTRLFDDPEWQNAHATLTVPPPICFDPSSYESIPQRLLAALPDTVLQQAYKQLYAHSFGKGMGEDPAAIAFFLD